MGASREGWRGPYTGLGVDGVDGPSPVMDDARPGASVRHLVLLIALGCTPEQLPDPPMEDPWPAPDAWGGTSGPGGPAVTFDEGELFAACAHLQGDPLRTADHHNHVVMHDGYLIMPWAPEEGIQRLDWTGETPFEIHTMRLLRDRPGFRLRFTAPADASSLAELAPGRLCPSRGRNTRARVERVGELSPR